MPDVDFSQFKDRGEKDEDETSTSPNTNGTSSDDELKWD
jgi:hypothetical protein